jgi:hypothetical protein
MTATSWPDALCPADPAEVQELLARFWRELAALAGLLPRREYLLAAEQTCELRRIVLALMLSLNGIARPAATAHLNSYLSASQRAALEKTLVAPTPEEDAWVGQAVALVVIYRWYAPQLVEKYRLTYPVDAEAAAWNALARAVPTWPQTITTD